MDTAVRNNDTFCILVEFNHFELHFLIHLCLRIVFFHQMFGSSKSFHTIGKRDHSTLVEQFHDCTFMNRAYSEDGFKHIPGILFQLLVSKTQTTVFFVDVKYLYLYRCSELSYFTRVFDFFRPGEVRNVNQAFNAFFNLHESTEIGEVTYSSCMCASNRIFHLNTFPWIRFQLFYTERHFAIITIECKNDCIYLFTYSHKVLCAVKMLGPAHFRNVNQTFHTRGNLNKCTVIGNNNHFSFYDIAYFQCFTQCIPWMRSQLFQTKGDTFFLVVEIEDDHVDLVVQLNNLFGMLNTSP